MADWSEVYSDLLSSYVEQYTDARGNPDLRAQILADVKSQILQQASSGSVELPQNLRVAIRRVFLPELDPEDQDDEEHIIESILAATDKRKEQPGTGEDEDGREERTRPTKAGNYRKPFTDFTASQQLFKEDMDAYDRERRDTKDPKTIGQRTKIIQQWWESLADDKKAEAGRAASKWNKLGAPKETHELYRRKNFPNMARDFIETVRRTMGSNIVMFLAHETTDSQIKMAVFETQPPDGKKAFSESSEPTKDWVLKGEQMLTNYLLTEAAEEDLNDENPKVEIALDDEGNPEVPAWTGQKLKVQQSLARMVFQAAYAKFTGKPKAKVPWGLLIKSHLEYLSSNSIPEGFVMKDPSKWTKADMWMLWNHWNSQEEEDKVIVSFIKCKKEDEPLGRPWNRKTPSKKREWMSPGEDSEAGVEAKPSDLGEEIGGAGMTPIATSSGAQDILDSGRAPSEDTPHESSPACHANGDRVKYLKSLCIMPRYQELVELVDGLPETEPDAGPVNLPVWASWAWSAQYLPQEMHGNGDSFWKALYQLQSEKFASTQKGLTIVLGFGLLWRECKRAQDIESDDPEAANLGFLLGSGLDIHKGEDVMGAVGLVVARLQQNSGGSSRGIGAQETTEVSAGDSCPTQGGGMKESWNTRKDVRKRKRGDGGDVDQKMAKEGEEASKKSTRARQPTKRALGLGL
ncbi:hypothetical protein F5J12DRAFT_895287 [Pisolithus orientalis]|uniref:uncharacterized protein n=1 Tax=Pisolithus orientalis TaxID=936130 RepID=UPI002224D41E|nr:uncharacterized protein F5J12DRAFT_895287 [Pisolithus orientalis]KAI5998897.1 hypothetical protein F5J12DRAFT_895287 [Pisolithus orientalis]